MNQREVIGKRVVCLYNYAKNATLNVLKEKI